MRRRRFESLGASMRPRTPNQLHAWLRLALDVEIARAPLLDGSDAPFDYLSHAFFEGDRPAGDCVVWANRGGGKTFLGAVATALDLIFKPGIEVRILGGSLEQSQRMHRHLQTIFDRPALRNLVDGRITERRVRLANGSLCQTLAQSHTSVRGCRPQKLRCDEVELFDPEVWAAAQLVTRSKVCGGETAHGRIEAFSTMHLPHGLMSRIVASAQEEPPARRLFRWGVVDALATCEPRRPCEGCALWDECGGRAKTARGHISVDDAIALKRRSGAEAWRSEMLCQRPSREDLVFPEFDRRTHVIGFRSTDGSPGAGRASMPAEPQVGQASAPARVGGCGHSSESCATREDHSSESCATWVCGMDFGFRAPTVALWGVVADGVLRIVDERIERGVVLEEHIEAILDGSRPRPAWVGVDPAGRQRSEQTGISAATAMRRAGLTVRDRRVALADGLAMIRRRLAPATGGPTLFVHQRCKGLLESLERYRFPSDKPEAVAPVKDGSDHAVDALRYLVVNLDMPFRTTVRRYI